MTVNWGALASSNTAIWDRAGSNLDANLQRIRETVEKRRLAQVLTAAQAGNPEAMRQLYAMNPQLAMQMEDQLHERGERGRKTKSRESIAAILLGETPANALAPMPTAPAAFGSGNALSQPAPPSPPPAPVRAAANPQAAAAPDPQPDTPDTQQEWAQYLGKLAEWADTPEKWDQAADYFVGLGYQGAAQFKGKFSPQARQQLMSQAGPGQSQRYSDAERAAIEADPEAFLTFQGKRLDVTGKQLKNMVDLNNASMQLLGGVHDQATYDAAKQRALQLYSSFGQDASAFLGGLPPEYSPETVRMLQLQGMDTSKQLAAIARENNIGSQIEVREQRADEYERHNRAMESNARRGQDRRGNGGGSKAPTPTSVIGRIMDKQARGEPLTAAERQTLQEYRAGKGSKGGRGGGADLIGQVYQRGGKRIQYSKSAGGYVDLATGQKVN